MGVRAHDRRDPPAADRFFERIEMFGQVRTGVDHGDFAGADQIGLGSVISECRRVVRKHARDPRLQLL